MSQSYGKIHTYVHIRNSVHSNSSQDMQVHNCACEAKNNIEIWQRASTIPAQSDNNEKLSNCIIYPKYKQKIQSHGRMYLGHNSSLQLCTNKSRLPQSLLDMLTCSSSCIVVTSADRQRFELLSAIILNSCLATGCDACSILCSKDILVTLLSGWTVGGGAVGVVLMKLITSSTV